MIRTAVLTAYAGCIGLTGSAQEVFLEAPEARTVHTAPSQLLDDLQLHELDKADRIDRLQDQLEALQRVLDRRRANLPAAMPEPPQRAVPEPPRPGIPVTEPPAATETEEPERALDEPSDQGTLPPGLTESAPAAQDAQSELFPKGIVDEPVDRLALADSLFASGQIDLALQAYRQVDGSVLAGEDRLWIEYQLANCHRRLQDYSEAERRYRQVAGEKEGGMYATQARWWLDSMTARRALEADLQRISQSLQSLKEQHNAPVSP
jgi:hypothetical protein